MEWFLNSDTSSARFARTAAQGVIALIPGILNNYLPYMPGWCGVVVVPVIMAILAPLMSELGKRTLSDSTVGATD